MKLTVDEKSLWMQTTALVIVFGTYFISTNYKTTDAVAPGLLFELAWLVIILISLNILGHIFAAIFGSKRNSAGPGMLLKLMATKIKSIILASGILLAIFAILTEKNELLTIYVLLIFLVVAEVTEKGIQLFYYRKPV